MIKEVTDQDYKNTTEHLENPADVSASFWLDETLDKYLTEENKWFMLLAYQRGYAKAVEDNAIPDFDEYDESEAYFLKQKEDSIATFKSKYENGCKIENIKMLAPNIDCPEYWENHDDND